MTRHATGTAKAVCSEEPQCGLAVLLQGTVSAWHLGGVCIYKQTRDSPTSGCSSCLLRIFIRMEKRGREPGGQGEGGSVVRSLSGSEWGFTGGWRNVHESFLFYCTFSIILRNSSKSSMPSLFLSPSFNSSSISSSEMDSPVLRMMRANSSLSM